MSSERTRSQGRDVTLALTPGQLLVLAIGVYALLRFLRGLRTG